MVPSNQSTRVILDTNVIIDLAGGDLGNHVLNEFAQMTRAGFAFSINEYVIDELEHKRGACDGRSIAHALGSILDPEVPLLPRGNHLYAWAGFGPLHASEGWQRTIELKALWGDWLSSLHAPRLPEHVRQPLATAVREEREKWILGFERFRSVGGIERRRNPDELIDEAFERSVPGIERDCPSTNIPASVRRNGHLRVWLLRALQQAYGIHPANLRSKSHASDLYDLYMLDALCVPAFLVTSDGPIVAQLRRARSYQVDWVLSPSVFLQSWKDGSLPQLSWPDSQS